MDTKSYSMPLKKSLSVEANSEYAHVDEQVDVAPTSICDYRIAELSVPSFRNLLIMDFDDPRMAPTS